MAPIRSSSPQTSPRPSRKSFMRRCERCCCSVIIYFPLLFVYGLTSWAVWVQLSIGSLPSKSWTGHTSAFFAFVLYILLNWSYTTAVFTDPGSSSRPFGGRSALPVQEISNNDTLASLTVKYNGEIRYCKKCQARKPDRAHHCSTCNRCVLMMDHHCPWLATCVGFNNRKAFILFLVYTCLYCWLACAASATWVWSEVLNNGFQDQLMPVNYILLAVLAGIIGLVLTGFTAWHLYLACAGLTTIESLEKTRYLLPLRKSRHHSDLRNYVGSNGSSFGDQLRQIHANAIPGITRPEEGEERVSLARNSLRLNYADAEAQRERQRYDDYLDEMASEKLPNAFNLGRRRNLLQLFGTRPLLWALPICNSTGDGWRWDTNPKWHDARGQLGREREARLSEQESWQRDHSRVQERQLIANTRNDALGHHSSPPRSTGMRVQRSSNKDNAAMEYASSSDDDGQSVSERKRFIRTNAPDSDQTLNWNDIPEDVLSSRRSISRNLKHQRNAAA